MFAICFSPCIEIVWMEVEKAFSSWPTEPEKVMIFAAGEVFSIANP
jgi:hypothetical protein